MHDWFYVEATHWNGQVTYTSGKLKSVLEFIEEQAKDYQSVKVYQAEVYDQLKEGWEL